VLDNGRQLAAHEQMPLELNFAKLTQSHINRVVEQLNNRPGKRLG
jgi:IS30 family transposase